MQLPGYFLIKMHNLKILHFELYHFNLKPSDRWCDATLRSELQISRLPHIVARITSTPIIYPQTTPFSHTARTVAMPPSFSKVQQDLGLVQPYALYRALFSN
jgi:hypothetical protein